MTENALQSLLEQQIVTSMIDLLECTDTEQILDRLESYTDPSVVAARYDMIARQLYNQEKNVVAMVAFGRAGIHYCLVQSKVLACVNPDVASKLKGIAKIIAYNVSANTWPGWDDDVTLTTTDRVVGLDAARLNLRLAQELNRDSEVMGNALWLLGAHEWFQGNLALAEGSFARSQAEFEKCGKQAYILMANGYRILMKSLLDAADEHLVTTLNETLQALRSDKSEDSKFFADQIETAHRAYSQMKTSESRRDPESTQDRE